MKFFLLYLLFFSIIPSNIIDSESGVTIYNQFRIRRSRHFRNNGHIGVTMLTILGHVTSTVT